MHNGPPNNTFVVIVALIIFTLLFLGVVAPSNTLAEETGEVSWGTADGDGIIEPGENATEELAKAAQNPVASMIACRFRTTPISISGLRKRPRTFSTSSLSGLLN